jgi:enoyl-CoA hydratase/carnithine racemase
MAFETIRYDSEGGVATITLDRPERHNAFNRTMALELREAWDRVKKAPEVVCAILTGAGEKALCTGMDVADVADGSARKTSEDDRDSAPWFHLTAIQNRCWKPVITAVNGMCCGGGLHFIADSDLILASETATFFDTHVKVGLVAGLEPVGLARRVPLEAVLRMALLGAGAPAAPGPRAGREDRRALADRPGAQQAGHLGEPRRGARRRAGPHLAAHPRAHGPPRPRRGEPGLRREAPPALGPLHGLTVACTGASSSTWRTGSPP